MRELLFLLDETAEGLGCQSRLHQTPQGLGSRGNPNPWLPLGLANPLGPNPRSMPESSRTHREFLPSAQQAIAELEQATGKPVLIVEEPELNVAATIRRARASQTSHILRWKSGSDPLADYLITFECRMALREPAPNASGAGRQAMGERPAIQERVIEEVEALYPQMPKAKARELGQFILNGLMLQLRSSGPKSLGTRDHRSWCGRLTEGGGEAYKYVQEFFSSL